MSTAIVEVQTAVAEFDKVAAGLAELQKKYAGVVFDVRTSKGMDEAKAARAEIREPRYEIERVRKAAKAPILKLGKELDDRAKVITSEILVIEEPIDTQIKNEEARKEAEKQAKIAAEQKRVADLQQRVADLRGNRSLTPMAGSARIAEVIADLEGMAVDASFEEFEQQAHEAKADGLTWLRELHAAAVAHEAEQARIKAEREELALLRAEQEKHQAAERARIAEEERVAKAAREAEAAKQAEELRKQREAQEAEQRAKEEQNRMRLSEIQGIQHQVMIASLGRAGVRDGGTRECITETLAETEAWEITEERFGPLFKSAESVKASAITAIRALLEQFDQQATQTAEEKRLAAERAEFEYEQAKFEKQQAEARKVKEEQERVERDRARLASIKKPADDELLGVLARHYNVPVSKVVDWLLAVDFTKLEQAA